MVFLFQKAIIETVKKELNIDLNSPEYANSIFSVDEVNQLNEVDKYYIGEIMVFNCNSPICLIDYKLESHENIPNQTKCFIRIEEEKNSVFAKP